MIYEDWLKEYECVNLTLEDYKAIVPKYLSNLKDCSKILHDNPNYAALRAVMHTIVGSSGGMRHAKMLDITRDHQKVLKEDYENFSMGAFLKDFNSEVNSLLKECSSLGVDYQF